MDRRRSAPLVPADARRLGGVAALVLLLASWLVGGAHVALEHAPGGSCHGSTCEHVAAHRGCQPQSPVVDASDAAARDESRRTSDDRLTEARARAGDECAIPQLLGEGLQHVPGTPAGFALVAPRADGRALAWRAPPSEQFPRFLLAPKNSPPLGAARVLA